jgi:hypothetical protein
MALKIKKIITNEKGFITEELEGTEAEIEAYEKKKSKKDETVKKKKDLLLGKEMLAQVQKMIDDAVLKHSLFHSHSLVVEHHWHQTNGWWWKPYMDQGQWRYYYTQNNPNTFGGITGVGQYATNGITSSPGVYTCNSAVEMGSKLGVDASYVEHQVGSGITNTGVVSSNSINGAATEVEPLWKVLKGSAYDVGMKLGSAGVGQSNLDITSGIVNMNIKS